MKWSLKLGTVAGIGIYVHWTFALLIGWIFFAYLSAGQSAVMAAKGAGFILAIFGCVVLHELGHATAAKRFGIRTRDITLLPIGGLARLERMPEKPLQEFIVALAGPAVNVVIAAVIFGYLTVIRGDGEMLDVQLLQGNFLARLMWVNAFLVVFNLLPAFPMDGGRVLRALLATSMDYRRATRIAARVGQGMAILFGIAGLFGNPFLLFIALFVFLGAQAESDMVGIQFFMRGQQVRDAMITRFRTLTPEATLDDAVRELLAGSQQDFPITTGEKLEGVLLRNDLIKALAEGGRHLSVREAMHNDCAVVDADESLRAAFDKMRQNGCSMLPVMEHGQLAGLITLEHLGEWMMISQAAHRFEGG